MAPAPVPIYFPPLDKCLAGEERLISWKTAYTSLCDDDTAQDNGVLEALLTDAHCEQILCQSLQPFAAPDSKSRSEFTSKTAPINISESSNGHYNLVEVKEDALWLSDKLAVEELTALRVVILEWQRRPKDQLLLGISGAASATTSTADMGGSLLAGRSSGVEPVKGLDFGDEAIRRDRQLEIFVEEKNYIMKLSALLVGRTATQDTNGTAKRRTWIDELAASITAAQCSPGDKVAHERFIAKCIDAIGSRLRELDDPSKRLEVFRLDESRRLIHAAATFQDVITAMRLLLANIFVSEEILDVDIVESWYKLMADYNFLQDVSPSSALPDASVLQSLSSLNSLAVLQLPQNMSQMQDAAGPILDGALYPSIDDRSWISNDACVTSLSMILYQAAQSMSTVAAPAIYAWGLMTSFMRDVSRALQEIRDQHHGDDVSSDGESTARRRSSARDLRLGSTLFETRWRVLLDCKLNKEISDDPSSYFVRVAADQLQVYSVVSTLAIISTTAFGSSSEIATAYIGRKILLELVHQSMHTISYGAEVLEAILAILSPTLPGASKSLDHLLANRLAGDQDVFRQHILDQALARYPFELTPMLRLFTALSIASSDERTGPSTVVQVLERLPTMTVMMRERFKSYVLEHEDDNTNSMLLTSNLPLFVSRQSYSMYGPSTAESRFITTGNGEDEHSNVFAIPAGAPGVVVRESRPMVFKLEHTHSALEYLGMLLSTILPNSVMVVAQDDGKLDRATASEIIALLTALAKASLRQDDGIEEARTVLGRFGFALPEDQDIISIVTDIFEMELLAHTNQLVQEGSLDLLVACAEFFNTLIPVSPERVWSLLARSSLLGINGGANALAAAVGANEVQTGEYRFLSTCISMYTHLLEDAIAGLVQRKARSTKTTNRFDSPVVAQSYTPDRTMSTVLNAYQTVMLDAWRSMADWRFVSMSEKYDMNSQLLEAFHTLLLSTHGVNMSQDTNIALSSLLIASAHSLVEGMAPSTGSMTALQKFPSLLSSGVAIADDLMPTYERAALLKQSRSAIEFLTTLLRTIRMTEGASQRTYETGKELLKGMSACARLLATDHSLKECVSAFLEELVQAINDQTNADPPSLLGQLNQDVAISFLSLVSQLDRPLREVRVESSIWKFLSAVLGSKQQWFAMYLLTGSLPKDRLKQKDKACNALKSKSLLTYALEQLSNISTLAPERAIAMLAFISAAQNAWIWATMEVRSHPEFLRNALDWVNTLQARASNSAQELILAHEHQMAAHLCDILAANLHASISVGDKTLLKLLVPKLAFFRDNAVRVDQYNRSLHKNLAENFERKFPHCQVTDFKRTAANPAPLGRDFVYDLDFATNLLQHDVAWHGALSGRNQGFVDEFARANVNLSLVEAQTRLLKSWNVLATTLCECVGQDAALHAELAKTALTCLKTNVNANLDQPDMDRIVRARAEMAFVILSTLVSAKSVAPEMKHLLASAWELIRVCPVDYVVGTAMEDVQYYRTLLRVLYLAIQPHAYLDAAHANPERQRNATDETKVNISDPVTNAYLVEIVAKVVAPGFRALCGNLHGDVLLALPGDFALLTALLQAILSVRGVSAVHSQIAEVIASTSVVRGTLSLYSWADQLAEVMDHDPIYGEVAIMLLLELSTVRPIAEHIALDGALAQLASANLSNYFRKPQGKTPFDQPQRMFNIWAHGFLPLCLNLLDAVGAPIAAEVATFLNSFPTQLARAQTALENREPSAHNIHGGAVTLSLAAEAHSLCLIALILSSDTARGAAEGIDAADVPRLAYDHAKVREDAMALTRQRTSLAARIVPVGERESEWATRDVGGPSDNLLQGKVVQELRGLTDCFED